MIKISIMIEGQNGLTWPRWQTVVRSVEDLGFAGLYRSDHFTNHAPPDIESLELWVSLTWLAGNTRRIHFGPLVTPTSFRHPAMTARMAAAVDDLSMGRLVLGVGAGWQEREHINFGFDLLSPPERFDRFEEGLQVITNLLRKDEPTSLSGQYYTLQDAVLLPRPARPGGPPLLIGGNGENRTLELAARYADEWNAVYLHPDRFRQLSSCLTEKVIGLGRAPADVRRSMMTNVYFGKSDGEVAEKLQRHGRTIEDAQATGIVAGTPGQIVNQLGTFADAGIQQVMLQWLDLDDITGLETFASSVLPQVKN